MRTWAVIRSFGTIWGILISAVVFNLRFAQLATRISDTAVKSLLLRGQVYEHATGSFVNFFRDQPVLRSQIISVYSDILKLVWQVAIEIPGLGFFLVFFEKEVKLRTKLETEFGMKQKNPTTADDAESGKEKSDPETNVD